MSRAAIIAKIRKCLALAASDNEHEAALALERAHALMAEHAISADDVDLADVVTVLVKGTGALKPTQWETRLAEAVARALDCHLVHVGDYSADWRPDARWQFVGVAPAPELAAYAWEVLFRQLRKLRQAYLQGALRRVKNAHRRTVRANLYCEGWASAVFAKVRGLRPSPQVAALLEKWKSGQQLGELKPRGTGGLRGPVTDDWYRGHSDGHDVQLNRGVGADAVKRIGG